MPEIKKVEGRVCQIKASYKTEKAAIVTVTETRRKKAFDAAADCRKSSEELPGNGQRV